MFSLLTIEQSLPLKTVSYSILFSFQTPAKMKRFIMDARLKLRIFRVANCRIQRASATRHTTLSCPPIPTAPLFDYHSIIPASLHRKVTVIPTSLPVHVLGNYQFLICSGGSKGGARGAPLRPKFSCSFRKKIAK